MRRNTGVLRGVIESPGERSAAGLRGVYDDLLAETVETVGVESVAGSTGVDRARLERLLAGGSPALTVEEAAAVLAADETRPDAGAVAAEARDILLLGMSAAVLDVETLAAEIDEAIEPKELQQKIEGRRPMALDEYAVLHSHIEGGR